MNKATEELLENYIKTCKHNIEHYTKQLDVMLTEKDVLVSRIDRYKAELEDYQSALQLLRSYVQ